MSRIGKLPIHIPAGVTVTFQDGVVAVKGPKGALSQSIDTLIEGSMLCDSEPLGPFTATTPS